MSDAGFEDFANAVGTRPSAVQRGGCHSFTRLTVLGGGTDASMIAALALAEGFEVTLFSAYGSELGALRAAGGITLRGDGPVGTFAIDQPRGPSIRTTASTGCSMGSSTKKVVP